MWRIILQPIVWKKEIQAHWSHLWSSCIIAENRRNPFARLFLYCIALYCPIVYFILSYWAPCGVECSKWERFAEQSVQLWMSTKTQLRLKRIRSQFSISRYQVRTAWNEMGNEWECRSDTMIDHHDKIDGWNPKAFLVQIFAHRQQLIIYYNE